MIGKTQKGGDKLRFKNKFALFSAILFLVILVAGSIVFVFSMRDIIRTNKRIELSRILEIEKIWLESTVTADISMVLKMADSPLIRQFFMHPENASYREAAMAELNSFRGFFSEGYQIFWVSDIDKEFHMDGSEPFPLDPDDPENYWYNMTLFETQTYNFNINYNPDLQAFKLWINAPVFGTDGTPAGMLGTGINITAFTERIHRSISDRGEMFFFNTSGEITGAADINLVLDKVSIQDEMYELGVDILAKAEALVPGEIQISSTNTGEVAIGTVPLLDWYTIVFMPESISDFDTVLTTFFLVVLVAILLIFIVFNVFIAGYLNSLRKTMDSLEIASNAKSTFLTNMSHEIRTPMNAIIGITDIMMQKRGLPDEITEGLGKIYGSCDLLLGIINDILDFSKIEAGKLDVMPAQYYVASLLSDSAHLNTMRINEKPIEFELLVDENVPTKLVGDLLRIKQVLNNLLSNSFKYTDAGKVTLSVSSETISDSENIMLVFEVKDTGYGMSKEQLEKLFDEYTRFNEASKRSIEGTGLGLAITQRLIYLMDGNIHVESKPGLGTSITVRLPQVMIDDDVLGPELAENLRRFYINYLIRNIRGRIEYEPMPYGRVLIVDDVETNLYVAVGLMRLYGLQIETAMNGRDAIAKVKNGEVYDVIFMDHMMPELDGMETTKRLRDMGYTEPVVALTANAVAGQADVFLQNGFDDFISKPIDIRQLNVALLKLIRNKQPPEVIAAAHLMKSNEVPETESEKSENINMDPLLMESFIRDAGKTVENLDKLLADPDFEDEITLRNLTITIHGIKSALRSLGESELSDDARLLEEACRDQNIGVVSRDIPAFLNKLRSLLMKLKPKQDTKGTSDDPEDIKEKILAIKEMCADYNRRGALSIISEIENCSDRTKAVLDAIKEQVLHSEYDEAESAAAEYADVLGGE